MPWKKFDPTTEPARFAFQEELKRAAGKRNTKKRRAENAFHQALDRHSQERQSEHQRNTQARTNEATLLHESMQRAQAFENHFQQMFFPPEQQRPVKRIRPETTNEYTTQVPGPAIDPLRQAEAVSDDATNESVIEPLGQEESVSDEVSECIQTTEWGSPTELEELASLALIQLSQVESSSDDPINSINVFDDGPSSDDNPPEPAAPFHHPDDVQPRETALVPRNNDSSLASPSPGRLRAAYMQISPYSPAARTILSMADAMEGGSENEANVALARDITNEMTAFQGNMLMGMRIVQQEHHHGENLQLSISQHQQTQTQSRVQHEETPTQRQGQHEETQTQRQEQHEETQTQSRVQHEETKTQRQEQHNETQKQGQLQHQQTLDQHKLVEERRLLQESVAKESSTVCNLSLVLTFILFVLTVTHHIVAFVNNFRKDPCLCVPEAFHVQFFYGTYTIGCYLYLVFVGVFLFSLGALLPNSAKNGVALLIKGLSLVSLLSDTTTQVLGFVVITMIAPPNMWIECKKHFTLRYSMNDDDATWKEIKDTRLNFEDVAFFWRAYMTLVFLSACCWFICIHTK